MKKVTIQDVAKELNLSRNTVARALNNSDTVAYETRYMVIEKACEMGYQKVSPSALNEFRIKTSAEDIKTIIVLARREISVFWNSIIMGISDAVNQNGCRLRFNFVGDEDERKLILPQDFQEEIDGVILISVFSERYMAEILKKGLPTVCLDAAEEAMVSGTSVDVVMSEGKESIRKITESLIGQGLKRIAFIGDITYCRTIRDRFYGYLAGMMENGLNPERSLLAVSHTENRYYCQEEVEAYLAGLKEMPEAIVCANDDIAFFAIRALRNRGFKVPEDVAVTGFDNQEGMSQSDAFLTTVKVGNQRLGRRLVCQLLFRLKNPEFPRETVMVDTEVIYRASSQKYSDSATAQKQQIPQNKIKAHD